MYLALKRQHSKILCASSHHPLQPNRLSLAKQPLFDFDDHDLRSLNVYKDGSFRPSHWSDCRDEMVNAQGFDVSIYIWNWGGWASRRTPVRRGGVVSMQITLISREGDALKMNESSSITLLQLVQEVAYYDGSINVSGRRELDHHSYQ